MYINMTRVFHAVWRQTMHFQSAFPGSTNEV